MDLFHKALNEFEQAYRYDRNCIVALSKSDAFMLVTKRYNGNVEEMFSVSPSRDSLSEELQLKLLKADQEAEMYGCSTKDFIKTDVSHRADIERSRGEKARDAAQKAVDEAKKGSIQSEG